MKISVIIPTYKPAEYIWECLDSLEKQTFPKDDFEVILVLNGCKEPYNTQIIEYIDKSNIQYNYIQTDQGGVSNARNIALDLAKGEYITFIDDDDFISPSYLEELYAKSSIDKIALCYPYAFKDGGKLQLLYGITRQYEKRLSDGLQKFQKCRKYFSGPWMKLIHRDVICDRRFDVRFKNGEDSLYMFLISNRFKYVEFTSREAIYYRRVRDDSAMRNRSLYDKLCNGMLLMLEYTKIYLGGMLGYSFSFYLTRMLATIKGMMFNGF